MPVTLVSVTVRCVNFDRHMVTPCSWCCRNLQPVFCFFFHRASSVSRVPAAVWLKGKADDFYRSGDYQAAANAYSSAIAADSSVPRCEVLAHALQDVPILWVAYTGSALGATAVATRIGLLASLPSVTWTGALRTARQHWTCCQPQPTSLLLSGNPTRAQTNFATTSWCTRCSFAAAQRSVASESMSRHSQTTRCALAAAERRLRCWLGVDTHVGAGYRDATGCK